MMKLVKPYIRSLSAAVLFMTCVAYAQSTWPGVSSDAQTEYSLDGKNWRPAVATWVYPGWPTMKGATYVWTTYKVSKQEAVHGSPVVTFRRKFRVPAKVTTALLRIGADDAYEASLNGKVLGSSGKLDAAATTDQQWSRIDSYTVQLRPGENELVVRAINYHWPLGESADSESNPGGVIFALAPTAPLAQTLQQSGKVDLYGILFDIDKAVLKPSSRSALEQVAKLLHDDPALRLEVAGHTDNSGSAAHNLALSQRRAAAVVAALVKDYRIEASRLVPKGYGDSQSVASNDSEEGRSQNRRVELKKL